MGRLAKLALDGPVSLQKVANRVFCRGNGCKFGFILAASLFSYSLLRGSMWKPAKRAHIPTKTNATSCKNERESESCNSWYLQETRVHETSVFFGNEHFLDHWAKIVGQIILCS